MIETSRRSFLGGLIGLIAAPSIVTAAGVRPGLWMPPRKLYVPSVSSAWVGFIDGAGHLVRWKPEGADGWLPIDSHHEAEHWKRVRFPSVYYNSERLLSAPWLVHR